MQASQHASCWLINFQQRIETERTGSAEGRIMKPESIREMVTKLVVATFAISVEGLTLEMV
jgi:hypothetical protein